MKGSNRCFWIVGIVCLVSCFSVSAVDMVGSGVQDSVRSLLLSPSCVSKEECCIPIGGDLFSFFEGKQGYVYSTDREVPAHSVTGIIALQDGEAASGSLSLNLEDLKDESKFIYTTVGRVRIHDGRSEQVLAMERLDYIYDEDAGHQYYRLSCLPVTGCDACVDRVYLIGSACKTPSLMLYGSVVYVPKDDSDPAILPFSISGRDPWSAEWHLEKQIARKTSM